MKLFSSSCHSRQLSARIASGALVRRVVRGSQLRGRGPRCIDQASLLTNQHPPTTQLFIGSIAITNAHNSSAISAQCNSDRSRITCLSTRFSHGLRFRKRQRRRTTRPFLVATQELEIHLIRSQQTRKLFPIAAVSRRLENGWHVRVHQSYLATREFLAPTSGLGTCVTYRKQTATPHSKPCDRAFSRASRAPQITSYKSGIARLGTGITTHELLITPRESRNSQTPTHGIIMLSYAQRASLTKSPVARPATGYRRGTKPASACGHLILGH
jgi:hypothetical protein